MARWGRTTLVLIDITMSGLPEVNEVDGRRRQKEANHVGKAGRRGHRVFAFIVTVVGVDLSFFRDHFWPRLMANVGIVLVVGAFYLRLNPL